MPNLSCVLLCLSLGRHPRAVLQGPMTYLFEGAQTGNRWRLVVQLRRMTSLLGQPSTPTCFVALNGVPNFLGNCIANPGRTLIVVRFRLNYKGGGDPFSSSLRDCEIF